MNSNKHYDLVVIGSGPGGYIGAIRASQLGMNTAIIERDRLGGVCLNWGCIPTKALLHNAELYTEAVTHGKEWGISFKDVEIDWNKIIGRSRKTTDTLTKGVSFLMKKNKVDHYEGHGKIVKSTEGSPVVIEIQDSEGDYYSGKGSHNLQTITADKVMISTGCAPRELPFAPRDGKVVISSYDAMTLPKCPEKMVVIGSGAIGMEFAYFYNAFGCDVTVVEMLDKIVPAEDEEVSQSALKVFKKQGINFKTGFGVSSIDKKSNGAIVTIQNSKDPSICEDLECDVVLVAIGVQGRTDGLLSDDLKIDMDNGSIVTDVNTSKKPLYKTSLPNIYAIGDVIGPPWLAHVASEEAVVCVERMAGHDVLGIDYEAIPAATYTNPQIASIGMTEQAAKEAGIKYKVGMFPMQASGKAIAVGGTDGFVKLITGDAYGEILGAHIFGEDASELIHEMGLAIHLEATAEDIITLMHAHPTISEGIHEAALSTEDRSLNA